MTFSGRTGERMARVASSDVTDAHSHPDVGTDPANRPPNPDRPSAPDQSVPSVPDQSVPSDSDQPVDVAEMRVSYRFGELPDGGLDDGWLAVARRWIAEAIADGLPEPNAIVLATLDADGHPATRTVLCKAIDERGIVFYTGTLSSKGQELAAQPVAAVTFPLIGMERQIHLRGPVERVSAEETTKYWQHRPRGSQLGAWASHQSAPIASRADLEAQLVEVTERFADVDPIPVPPNWGGYLLRPRLIEFWQGRADRLHDRLRIHPPDPTVVRLQP